MAQKRSKNEAQLLTQIYVMLSENTEMTKKLHKVIYEGNGKASLLSRMELIENQINKCPIEKVNKKVESIEKKIWYASGIFATIIVALTSIAKKLGWW